VTTVDVAVIGGGPAGHAAALAAAGRGATVALLEAEAVGGQCVHSTCIPSGLMLSAAVPFVEAQELAMTGVIDLGADLNLGRAQSRRQALVARLAKSAADALRVAGVKVVLGRARFVAPGELEVLSGEGGTEMLTTGAVVVATGSRWEPPHYAGVPDSRVVTLDSVVALDRAPSTALVLAGGPSGTAFAVEAAFLMAAAGAKVVLAAPGDRLVGALDLEMDEIVRSGLEVMGVRSVTGASLVAATGGRATLMCSDGDEPMTAELVVAPDLRRPHTASLRLERAGVTVGLDGSIAVDEACRTSVRGVLAAGDVTGETMVTAAAQVAGRVAGANAAGAGERLRLDAVPRVLHCVPGVAWVGLSEEAATADGWDVTVSFVDLTTSARSVVLGGREGVLKLVADRELGQVLGVQMVGSEAAEIAAVAALAIQAELTVDDLAASVHWHPSAAESLADAARRLTR
jgi:dihydrolipoamide dehydrogenase